MAQIINHWPHRSYFDHIFTGTVGMFQSSEDIVEEVANGLHNLVPEGTAQLFLPATMAQNQLGLNNMALQFFLNQKRVEVIREWTPLGAYEIVYGKYDVKKMRVGLRERDVYKRQVQGSGVIRVDIMTDHADKMYVLEYNTVPGMTATSLVPKAANEMGIDFPKMCIRDRYRGSCTNCKRC